VRVDQFEKYLSKEYRGLRSGRPLTSPAIRDAVSRCRRIERTLAVDLDDCVDGESYGLKNLLNCIEQGKWLFDIDGDSRTGLASIKNAAKRYNDFKVWDERADRRF